MKILQNEPEIHDPHPKKNLKTSTNTTMNKKIPKFDNLTEREQTKKKKMSFLWARMAKYEKMPKMVS